MNLSATLDALGYSSSESFLQRGTAPFGRAPDIGHILRTAAGRQACRLEGVYTLRPFKDGGSSIPVVYVCEASDMAAADKIHRLVWNQDIAPFLLVHLPVGLRLYSGFRCDDTKTGEREGVLEPLILFNEIADRLSEFRADAIDSGEVWRKRGNDVQPDKRVYWGLLENLKQLAKKFRDQFGRDNVKSIIHPLIGKYVYLHYLKDRGFLSPWRLEKWQINPATVYGRTATVAGLRAVCKELDGFLNGRVFPLKFTGPSAPTEDQIQRIAGAFAGDTFDGQWQFHLPFTAFKFDYIPIETLSMIYEQFLHLPDKPESDDDDEHTEGRKAGAYYTPIPVVNYMLAEMDKRRRLQRGVRVWDPSCGSGAFLVQCYRRLIERELVHRKRDPTPHELATLLKRHIFGVDMDENACSVAEFSLYLTLLDYVKPADLKKHPGFRLPTLRKQNIFCADFFKFQPFKSKFHWIVGNPPWKKLVPGKLEERDQNAMNWIRTHADKKPVGDNSLAQAFAWRCLDFMVADGECALLLPAMTLFEDFSEGFRSAFFKQTRLHAVANFSNLAEVLFAGRSRVPAAALFFTLRRLDFPPDDLEMTAVFSPLVANQESTRPVAAGVRTEVWSITVNGDEVREIPYCNVGNGDGLAWKLAAWGSELDASLLAKMERRWPRLEGCEAKWQPKERTFAKLGEFGVFGFAQGPDLGNERQAGFELVEELIGKNVVDVDILKKLRRIFSFQDFNFPKNAKHYLRHRGGWKGLPICRPPHVIVSAARNYAVFSEKYLVVESRQIGIVSVDSNRQMLKALALYLSSDFAFYHSFLTSTQFGVQRGRATLESLRQLPVPLLKLTADELAQWEVLHDRLARTKPRVLSDSQQPNAELSDMSADDGQDAMVEELNRRVSDALGLDEIERALVHDLVHVRLALNDGKIGQAAMRKSGRDELQTYAEWLQRELSANDGVQYSVAVLQDAQSGFVAIRPDDGRASVRVLAAESAAARALTATRDHLREERAQWVYFDRALRIHRGKETYFFKPIHIMHWTRTRAMLDAADVSVGSIRGDELG